MRPVRDMETIQIEITNACINTCSNCTRLIGHHSKPYFMDFDFFKNAVDSLKYFRYMVGIMGGEPLLHPQFEEFSLYLHEKYPSEKCGLWTCLPNGKEHYAELICEVYGNVFINDHTRNDILHTPILVASDELINFKDDMWYMIDNCWVNAYWSASINPKGAFFCEVAAAIALLIDGKSFWKVEEDWWTRAPIDYVDQMREYCTKCGCAMPLLKRSSIDIIDDISPKMYEMLKDISPKIKKGHYKIHDLTMAADERPMATYKDEKYRKNSASRYDMILRLNEFGYMKPYMKIIGGKKNANTITMVDV